MADAQDTPRLEVMIAAPPEVVWPALRDPDLIRRWHGWHYDGPDGTDGLADEVDLIYVREALADDEARVLEVQGGDRFTLHPTDDGGTRVSLTRAPVSDDPDWAAYYDDVTEGWRAFLAQLRFAVERHDLAERRTLVLDGVLADTRPLLQALGLAEAAALPVGAPYRTTAATGQELAGTVWSRDGGQVALTVDDAGDGLLLLAEQPPAAHRPDGGVLVLLTSYAPDEAAHERVAAPLRTWWDANRRAEEPAPDSPPV